jgi:hypothetical protein
MAHDMGKIKTARFKEVHNENFAMGSELPFAAAAHEINAKLEGERRLSGTKPTLRALGPMAAF